MSHWAPWMGDAPAADASAVDESSGNNAAVGGPIVSRRRSSTRAAPYQTPGPLASRRRSSTFGLSGAMSAMAVDKTTATTTASTLPVVDRHASRILPQPEAHIKHAPPRRVHFNTVARQLIIITTDGDAMTACHQVDVPLRPSDDRGRYYPASAAQAAKGLKLEKRWPNPEAHEPAAFCGDAFCACVDGCASGRCPCSAEGVGCWWEGWGCACGAGACKAAVPGHVFDELAIAKARRSVLRRMAIGTTCGSVSRRGRRKR